MKRVFPCLLALAVLLGAGCARNSLRDGVLLVTVEGNIDAPRIEGRTVTARKILPVSPEVLPSAASALTGLFPPQHGLRVDGVGALPASVPTLGTMLSARGYACGAFLSTAALSPTHGLNRGFAVYEATIAPTNGATRFVHTPAETVDSALAWLAKQPKGKPVFLWVHLAPFAGAVRTNVVDTARLDELAPLRTSAAIEVSRLAAAFRAEAPMLVLPLFGLGGDHDFRGLSLDDPAFQDVDAYVSGLADGRNPLGVADAPFSLGAVETAPEGRYMESLVPWYAFRLSPLQRKQGDVDPALSVLQGITEVKAVPLAFQDEAVVLRANGHLGEGLVPPCTNVSVRASLGTNEFARIARAREAFFLPTTNRLDALKALTLSDPDVPLFHHAYGEALLHAKDYTGACNALSKASRIGFNMVLANRLQARCHAAIGNVPAAIDRAESAFLVNEGDPLTRRELASLLLRAGASLVQAGELRPASDCLSRVLLLDPDNKAARKLTDDVAARLRVPASNPQTPPKP